MDFKSGEELLKVCSQENIKISEAMRRREMTEGGAVPEEVEARMRKALEIMKNGVRTALNHPQKSMSGLIGGEAKRVTDYVKKEPYSCGDLMGKVIAYSMGLLEVNASMGVIVAVPTAGSCGVLPGALLALQETYDFPDEKILDALFNAAAVGYLLTRNASVSGAEAGCQAEIGSGSAMAASAITELLGGTPEMCLQAAAMALSNMLGLVCDPVAGLVEVPCQSRNATGALNAVSSAQIILSGTTFLISFDEMAEVMLHVGRGISYELRETSIGGCAGTPSARCFACR